MTKRVFTTFVTAASMLVLAACRPERASVEELYATRMLALGYLQRNQLAQAESTFKKLSELAPDDPFGYTNLGLTYLQEGQLENAEKQLLRARKLDPSSAEVELLLAKVYSLTGRSDEARTTLEQLHRDATGNARVLFALAALDSQQKDPASAQRYAQRLREVLAVSPANLAARLMLIEELARIGEADSVVRHLEEVRRIPPEPPRQARTYVDSTIQLIRAGKLAQARPVLDRLIGLMKVTTPYQASLEEVKSPEGPLAGRPSLTFAPKNFISLRRSQQRPSTDVVRFTDVSNEAGLPPAAPGGVDAPGTRDAPDALAVGDVDGDGADDMFISTLTNAGSREVAGWRPVTHLFRVRNGILRDATERSGILLPRGAVFATFADYDNDGWLDLLAIGGEGRAHLFRKRGDGSFEEVTAKARIDDIKGAHKALFADLDHDGDLDLLLVSKGQSTVYRNNLDGTFTEATASFGLSGISADDAAVGDFDGDGRLDVFFAGAISALFHNGGIQRFANVTATSGLAAGGSSTSVAVGDYDNDGFLDLFVARAGDGDPALWLNKGDGTFRPDGRSRGAAQVLRSSQTTSAMFVDYDNDGWLDLVVAQRSRLVLLRNDGTGRFVERSSLFPAPVRNAGARVVAVTDFDADGDEDLMLVDGRGAPGILRNDFGNNNLAVNVDLKALRNGSGKNNTFGIGSKLQLRAGEIYQTRVVSGRTTHFGLGPHLKADVLRVEWPNGVPQTIYFPGTDQDVVEGEMLKGSCAFVYTWDGKQFTFVTDAMWRSALGMPLGLMGSTSAFAPAGASQEYVRISGDALRPRDGRYVLQFTEELWETAYADEVKLVAVDHPDSVDVFVDERFVPPGPVAMRLFQTTRRYLPLSATDERGNDVLPALRDVDDVYASNFTATQYQGVVEPHDLILDLGVNAGSQGSFLFLRGWIYPTDASINVALSQQSSSKAAPHSLEVHDANGKWRTVSANIGFPSGKNKTIVVDLAGIFPTADHHVRIRTSMQIYWDQAFVARNIANSQVKTTTLAPLAADLHFRGFSRMYRKGGRYGPYWFAYDDVKRESPWRPISGAFTRFGDVVPLLRGSDDQYIVMAAGDEATIQFDASSANKLPPRWTRDFLLYTDGWVKDSDLNTAFGTTVGPLPFHRVSSYPYGPSDRYPDDAEHQRYLHNYNTRIVGRSISSK